jgi:uncharacterized protein involved in exopolysaccharide biosynthesis
MIAHFKPTPRVITVAAALLALALVGVTFTGAAEKDKPKSSDKQTRDATPADADRRLEVYDKELAKLDEQIRDAQKQADRLKEELGVAMESVKADFPEMLRELERERIIAQSEYQQLQSLYTQLTKLSRPELLKLLPTASPDPLLLELCKRKQTADQDLAEASDTYGQGHPEVTRKVRLVKIIDQQINERMDGILNGLKIKMESYKQKVDSLKAEVDKVKKNDIELAIKSRPYFQKKRDLETLQAMRERLQYRILQDRIDAFAPEKSR